MVMVRYKGALWNLAFALMFDHIDAPLKKVDVPALASAFNLTAASN